MTTLYMQELRGWSPLETGMAIFPGGFLVAPIAPRLGVLIGRFGVQPLIFTGLALSAVGYRLFLPIVLDSRYALFLPIVLDSRYALGILPTVILGGLGLALVSGPLNIAATKGIAPEEQGPAGGLVNTSFQFGGALVLAVATAASRPKTAAPRVSTAARRNLVRN